MDLFENLFVVVVAGDGESEGDDGYKDGPACLVEVEEEVGAEDNVEADGASVNYVQVLDAERLEFVKSELHGEEHQREDHVHIHEQTHRQPN
mmetsp:Transcript_25050/g.18890  ORF Transcript_25050/g.18890 Transcript_25050/m.18890 type:complete len:92 (-) Transcript_25050:436-711(-)